MPKYIDEYWLKSIYGATAVLDMSSSGSFLDSGALRRVCFAVPWELHCSAGGCPKWLSWRRVVDFQMLRPIDGESRG